MNSAPRRGLGRGLGELLNRSEPEARVDGDDGGDGENGEDGVISRPSSPPGQKWSHAQQQERPREAPVASSEGSTRIAGTTDGSGAETQSPGEAASETDAPTVPVPEGSYFAEIPVLSIRANPRQPRASFDEDAQQELVDSVAEIGVLQPVVVRPLEMTEVSAEHNQAQYELVMGERRWRAVRTVGLVTIPAIVRRTEEHAMLRDALLENLHRTELSPLEEASAYQQLLDDFDCTQDELASRIKRSRPQISNTLRLLRLPPAVQRRVAAGVLSAGHARALLGVDDPAAQERIAQRVVAEGLSVRGTEEVAALGEEPAKRQRSAPSARASSPRADEVADQLSERLETRVRVSLNRSRGKISIEFATEEDLERIAQLITNDKESP